MSTKTATRPTTPALITTQNESWGFYGMLDSNFKLSGDRAAVAFDAAARAVMVEYKLDAPAARRFLDSRYARHVADRMTFSDNPDLTVRLLAVLTEWAKQTKNEVRDAKNSADADWYNA